MRSAAVFFLKRHAMRALPSPRRAEAAARGDGRATRRFPEARNRASRPLTRSLAVRDYRPRGMRMRREVLVPRGFVPLRTH
jgi:hypothetical protein